MITASVRPDPAKGGYATAAAAMISLGLAAAAAAAVTLGLTQLRLARADLARTQAAARLDGAQVLAAYGVMRNSANGRLRWSEQALGSQFEILAEPEVEKLNAQLTASSQSERLQEFGAANPLAAAAWLRDQGSQPARSPIADGDPSGLWKRCAPSLLSYYGKADKPALAPAAPPVWLSNRSHVGEVWRIAINADGWTDERLVRITGNGRLPAITIQRRLQRAPRLAECTALMVQS